MIVKANDFIQARFNLTLNEQKLFLYAVSKLDRDMKEFSTVTINIKDFTVLVDTTSRRYEEIRDVARSLRSKEVFIKIDEKEVSMGWFSKVKSEPRSGDIEVYFDGDLMPYLLQLKSRFTRYQLKNILYLKNKYSIRMYELLKQYEVIKTRQFNLIEFKNILMLDDSKYERFYDFNKYILEPSSNEINKYTDINISYEKVTKGRKVIGIKYTINSKSDDEDYVNYLNENYNIREFKVKSGLESEKFNSKQIIELFTVATEVLAEAEQEQLFEYIKLNYLHMLNNKTVKNKYSYLKKALAEDYAVARAQIKFGYKID